MSSEQEIKRAMWAVGELYALLLLIDEIAKKALKDGTSWEMDASLCKIREIIKPLLPDTKSCQK